jgi:hypothetical protein
MRAGYYASRALLLEFDRRRWSSSKGHTKDVALRRNQQNEITRLMQRIGPRPFWILSGLRRRGDRIVRHNSRLV